MKTLLFYGVIAVKFTPPDKKHPHSISHVFIIRVIFDEDTHATIHEAPGTLINRKDAILLMNETDLYTLVWDYEKGFWKKGAQITTERVGNETYLKTVPNGTVTDNLENIIDYDFFAPR